MDRADGTRSGHTPAGWLVSVVILVGGAAYVCAFWGAGVKWSRAWLPEWYVDLVLRNQRYLYTLGRQDVGLWLLVQFAFALVPAALLLAMRWKPAEIGLGGFNALGRRLILVSVAASIPFGFLLMSTGAIGLPNTGRETVRLLASLATTIPEHIVVCGLLVALLLPGRRLPATVPVAPIEGPPLQRLLRWLGLAQPPADANGRLLAWFGLSIESLVAIFASGVVFWLAHLGKPDVVEVSLSLVGGVVVAYVTLRSGSVWPAIIAHLTMSLVPGGIALLAR